MRLSVVIPLYNNVRYLRDCVDSLYKQGIEKDEFEVIIVDDGSTDGSENLANELALEHNNIKVLHQMNQGPGVARNTGMAVARGNYIHFVDADDFLLFDSYKYIFENLLKYDADILYMGFVKDSCWGESAVEGEITFNGEIHKYIQHRLIRVAVWNKIFKRSFLENNRLCWLPLCYGEDTCFTWNIMRYRGTIIVDNTKIYSYRTNNNSLERIRSVYGVKRTVQGLIIACEKLKDFSKDYTDCPAVRLNFTYKYRVLFNRILCVPYSYEEISEIFKKCSAIGIEHLCPFRSLKICDYLFHHPKLYFVFRPIIRFVYNKKYKNLTKNDDFIKSPLNK